MMTRFQKVEWQSLQIWDYIVLDIEAELARLQSAVQQLQHIPSAPHAAFEDLCHELLASITNPTFSRKGSAVHLDVAKKLFAVHRGPESATAELIVSHYERALRLVNLWLYQRLDAHLEQIIKNVSARIRYDACKRQ